MHEEGLEGRFERHRTNSELLWDGVEASGLKLAVPLAHRLRPLTTVFIPEGADDGVVRPALLDK